MYQIVTEHVFVTDTVCILQMYVPNCYRTCICYRHSVYSANVCTKLLQNMYLLQTQCVYCKCMYQTVTEHVFVTDTVCILQMYVPNCYRTCICYRHSVYSANVCTKLLQNMYLLQTQCVYCKCMYQTVTEHVFVTDTVCILQMYVPNCYRTCICYRHSVYTANVCTKLLQNMYLLQTQCVYCKCMYQTVTEHVFVTDTVCIVQMCVPNCYRTCICYRHSVCTANVCTKLLQNMCLLQTQCVHCKCIYQTVTEHVFVTDTVCALRPNWPKIPEISRRRSCELIKSSTPCVRKAVSHLELIQNVIDDWFRTSEGGSATRGTSSRESLKSSIGKLTVSQMPINTELSVIKLRISRS